jgi:hypothetical protein
MALPLNMDNWFLINNSLAAGKVRILSQYNTGLYDMNMCLTTPQFTDYAGATGATGGTLVPMISDSTALGINDFIVIGNSGKHKNSNLSYITPMYFACSDFDDDALYIAQLLALPYFGDLGNTPTSTTDRDALTKQIYEAGMWIWRKDNLPPINMECRTHLEFELDECYGDQTGNKVYNLAEVPGVASPDDIYFTIHAGNYGLDELGGTAGVPYIGTIRGDLDSSPSNQTTLTSGGDFALTNLFTTSSIEWIAKNNSNNSGSGLRIWQSFNNECGYSLGNSPTSSGEIWCAYGQIQVGTYSTPPVDNRLRHHAIVTMQQIFTTAASSSLWYGDSRDNWGRRGQSLGLAPIGGSAWDGSAYIIRRYQSTKPVDVNLGCLRAWNGYMTEGQAELCWLHNKWRVVG